MNLVLRQNTELKQERKVILINRIEVCGEIPIYSLHRIKNILKKIPLGIGENSQKLFFRFLVKRNNEYKKETGNDWNCLTSNNLIEAITDFNETILEMIEKKERTPDEINKLNADRELMITMIQQWFEANYTNLLYDMDKKIPWAVIARMRRNLSQWVLGAFNPFQMNVETLIFEVAEEQGLKGKFVDMDDAWEQMGGKPFVVE